MLVLLHVKGMLIVGKVDAKVTKNSDSTDAEIIGLLMDEFFIEVKKPRLMFRQNSEPNQDTVVLSHLPTEPEFILCNTNQIDYIYPNNDPAFAKYYEEMTENTK